MNLVKFIQINLLRNIKKKKKKKFVKVEYELEYYTKEIIEYFQKKFKQFHISMGYEYVLVTVFLFFTWAEAII